jgi:caffeoyl-CoA O-methyltransferase
MSNKQKLSFFSKQQSLFLSGVETYAEQHSSPAPILLQKLETQTEQHFGTRSIMLAGQTVGRLLKLLAFTLQPRLAVDVGTFTGFSALSLAEGLLSAGRVITCESDPTCAALAKNYFEESVYDDIIELKLGPAQETLANINEEIGLAFVDAQKADYWECYNLILDRLAPNGLVVVDNTLLLGSVLLNEEEIDKLGSPFKENCRAIVDFNERLQQDTRTEHCLLTISDGITLVARRTSPQ